EVGLLLLPGICGVAECFAGPRLWRGAVVRGVLLDAGRRRLSPPLELQGLAGGAVFGMGADGALPDGSVLPALLADALDVFKEEQRRMAGDESCACRACRDIPNLDLKVVVHHGHFARQTVGGRARVAGPDVILVHRLLKNPVRGSAYLLLTASALERVGLDPVASGMRQHFVSYPHLGEVPCFVADLEPLARRDLAAASVLAA